MARGRNRHGRRPVLVVNSVVACAGIAAVFGALVGWLYASGADGWATGLETALVVALGVFTLLIKWRSDWRRRGTAGRDR